MKVFKFGGASVKDTESLRNVAQILQNDIREHLVIVVSAMGETTNALEQVVDVVFNKKGGASALIDEVQSFHMEMVKELFPNESHPVYQEIESLFAALEKEVFAHHIVYYDQVYDQIVSYGELLSSLVLFHYLQEESFSVSWLDARKVIRTDTRYRDAVVDWKETSFRAKNVLSKMFEKKTIIVTQGFIAGNDDQLSTTLGREGSDYSGAIFAYVSDASSLTIWKDVPGLLTADPKYFSDTELIQAISYKETIELAFYGASIIHPKTIKPLQNKSIPLYVKSFKDPKSQGTIIHNDIAHDNSVSSIIVKREQVLLTISARDFSFVDEKNMSIIYDRLARNGIKVNLMQNSAISLSVCVDSDDDKIATFIVEMKGQFKIRFNEALELLTLRYYTEDKIKQLIGNKEVLLEQKSRITAQYIVKA